MAMILCAGANWSPELVGWGSAGPKANTELPGYYAGKLTNVAAKGRLSDDQRKKQTLNFWDVPGIYVLYRGDAVVYVGKSEDGGIGARLKQHHQADHLVGRWDTFSWVSPTPVVEVFPGNDATKPAEKIELGLLTTVPTITDLSGWLAEVEALGILLARPLDNRQVPDLSKDIWWFTQVRSEHARLTQEEMIAAIHEKLCK